MKGSKMKEKKDVVREFPTPDSYFTTGLTTIAEGENIDLPFYLREINNRLFYVFEATPDLYRVIALYNGNHPVPVLSFIDNFKKIRGMLFSMKARRAVNGR